MTAVFLRKDLGNVPGYNDAYTVVSTLAPRTWETDLKNLIG